MKATISEAPPMLIMVENKPMKSATISVTHERGTSAAICHSSRLSAIFSAKRPPQTAQIHCSVALGATRAISAPSTTPITIHGATRRRKASSTPPLARWERKDVMLVGIITASEVPRHKCIWIA